MKVLRSPESFRRWRAGRTGKLVFVPTMGALHDGHEALVRHARKLAGNSGTVVVSIFVNPTQFGPKEDFGAYPRPFARDREVCRRAGADAIFAPTAESMYFPDRSIWVDEASLSQTLCGKSRPGHFRGVCTVVAKLFLIVTPQVAVFGEKDWQQLAILRRMVRDLNFDIKLAGYPTVREADGLARSSRNAYLTSPERAVAPGIHAALQQAVASRKDPRAIEKLASSLIAKVPGARMDYVEAVDAETLQPLKIRKAAGRLACAVFLGRARLIDNIAIPPLS